MNDNYPKIFRHLFLMCLVLITISVHLDAQITLERELIGAVATTSTVVSGGGEQQLLVDASFGETMIGYEEGEIVITVGFQQTNLDVEREFGNLDSDNEEEEEAAVVSVNAYPNPTVERLTVDLGDYQDKFTELRLIDVYGRIVKFQKIVDQGVMTFRGLDRLPNANYFLQGIGKDGKLHQLATVLVITY